MPLTATQFHATCDCREPDTNIKCGQEGIGTLNHLSSKGWMIRFLLGGRPELKSIINCNGYVALYTIICPRCSVTGAWKR